MVITPDGHLLGRCDGEAAFKAFLGASEDLIKNIHGVAPVADLDGDEVGYLVAKVSSEGKDRTGKPLKVLSPEMQKAFGSFGGHVSIQRSPPRWVEPGFVDKAFSYVTELE